ncbi:MAG: hypothetical protein ACRD1U_02170 [Vicinamibacterales bacterium]
MATMDRVPHLDAHVTAQVVAGLDCLPSLEREWRQLFNASGIEPAMSFEWTQALAETHVDPMDRCCVVQLRRGERLVGVVPMFTRATHVFGTRPEDQLRRALSAAQSGDVPAVVADP